MPRNPNENEWEGFRKVYDATGTKITGSHCLSCKQRFSRTGHGFHRSHRELCNKQKSKDTNYDDESNLSSNSDSGDNSITPPSVRRKSQEDCNSQLNATKKQRRSSESNVSNMAVHISIDDYKKKCIALVNHCLRFGIDLADLKSIHIANLCQAFDPAFKIPSVDIFKQKFLPQAYDDMVMKNSQLQIMGVIVVLVHHQNNSESTILSMTITDKKQYIYLEARVITDLNDEELQHFCDLSVVKLFNIYQVKCKFLVHNGNYTLNFKTAIDDETSYYTIKCFSSFINTCLYEHGEIPAKSYQDHVLRTEYYETVNNLLSKISNLDLGSATKEILDFLNNKKLPITQIVRDESEIYINQLSLAAMFFNHTYHINYMSSFYKTMLCEFLSDCLPGVRNNKDCSSYLNKTGVFKELFGSDKIYTPQKFWAVASFQGICLSDFALDILSVPAIPKRIDVSKIIYLIKQFQDNELMKSLSISLVISDVK